MTKETKSVMCKWCYAHVMKSKSGNWFHKATWKRKYGFCDKILTDDDILEFEDTRKIFRKEQKDAIH